MNKVSVIIPTYEEEKYIERCLKSLTNQTLSREHYEIIVVDANSKDKTVEIARKYADKVIIQKSSGVGGARNDGAKIARSEIIATTDADAILPKHWLERIVFDFESKDIVAVFGPIIPIENKFKYNFLLGLFNNLARISAKLKIFYATVGSNIAFKRDIFLKIGGFAEMLAGDDYEIAFRLRKQGTIYYDPKLYVYFSMRRMEKFGLLYSLYLWAINTLATKLKLHKKIKIKNYVQQKY